MIFSKSPEDMLSLGYSPSPVTTQVSTVADGQITYWIGYPSGRDEQTLIERYRRARLVIMDTRIIKSVHRHLGEYAINIGDILIMPSATEAKENNFPDPAKVRAFAIDKLQDALETLKRQALD